MTFEIGIAICVGFIIGILISFMFRKRPSGTLRIDTSNPAKDIYRLDLDDLDGLDKKKRIVLKIDNNADLSHK